MTYVHSEHMKDLMYPAYELIFYNISYDWFGKGLSLNLSSET